MKDDLNQMIPEHERRERGETMTEARLRSIEARIILRNARMDLLSRLESLMAQMRVDALRGSMGLPPQPTLPIRDEDFRLPIEGDERE